MGRGFVVDGSYVGGKSKQAETLRNGVDERTERRFCCRVWTPDRDGKLLFEAVMSEM